MQIVEHVGGTFLLQETKPTALYGVLTIVTTGSDKGWILACLSPSGPGFSCNIETGGLNLTMNLDVAIRLASTLLLLSSQHLPELCEDRVTTVGDLEICCRASQKVMSWHSAKNSPQVKFTVEEDNVEVRFQSTLATTLAFRILRQIGQLSAQPAQDAQ